MIQKKTFRSEQASEPKALACGSVVSLVVALTALCSSTANGAAPLEKLPPPLYSFDIVSPQVVGGTFAAGDVLSFFEAADAAEVHNLAVNLGLLDPTDELDALSGPNSSVLPTDSFSLLLSITRGSTGGQPPAPELTALDVPFNPQEQAAQSQAAGDQYMSLVLCTLQGGCEVPPATGGSTRAPVGNMALVRNNYNEGGTGFGALPSGPALRGGDGQSFVETQDNVDAMAGTGVAMTGPGVPFYYSISRDSPSLIALSQPGPPSGANIFFDPNPSGGGTVPSVYAAFSDLGLSPGDDLDAMIVFDADGDGLFNNADSVLFSLTADSPSLSSIANVSVFGPAGDVFLARPGVVVAVFSSVTDFGLSDRAGAGDDVDAMDFFFTNNSIESARLHGIRGIGISGIPTTSSWGVVIMTMVILLVGSILLRRVRAA